MSVVVTGGTGFITVIISYSVVVLGDAVLIYDESVQFTAQSS